MCILCLLFFFNKYKNGGGMVKKIRILFVVLSILLFAKANAMLRPLLIDGYFPSGKARFLGIDKKSHFPIIQGSTNAFLWKIIGKYDISAKKTKRRRSDPVKSLVMLQLYIDEATKEYLACDREGYIYFTPKENSETDWIQTVEACDTTPYYVFAPKYTSASVAHEEFNLLTQLFEHYVK